MKTTVAAVFLAAAPVLLAPALAAAEAAAAAVKSGRVDGATAKSLAAAGAKMVDVRTAEEYASGHVPGAINIPYDQIARRASEIGPPSTQVVLYCRTGRRSAIAVEALQKAGYEKLYDLRSVTAWPGELTK